MNLRSLSKRTILLTSLVVVLALLVAAGTMCRYNYTRSPQYSLHQLARAAAEKDWDGVQKYVDFDCVVSQGVDEATIGVFGGDDTWWGAIAAEVKQWMKPGLTRGSKYVVRTGIETGPSRSKTAVGLTGLYSTIDQVGELRR